MNLFYLDRDPVIAASYHYDKHKVKMVLEAAQMLCTAHHHWAEVFNYKTFVPYKKAHYNHPSTIWTRSNKSQYMWVYNYMMALGREYTKRYGKEHLTITKCKMPLHVPPNGMIDGLFTEPPQCMPDEYKDPSSLIAYWNYYENEKQNIRNKNEQKITRPSNINELCEY